MKTCEEMVQLKLQEIYGKEDYTSSLQHCVQLIGGFLMVFIEE